MKKDFRFCLEACYQLGVVDRSLGTPNDCVHSFLKHPPTGSSTIGWLPVSDPLLPPLQPCLQRGVGAPGRFTTPVTSIKTSIEEKEF